MNKKWVPFAVVIILALALFFIKRSQNDAGIDTKDKTKKTTTTVNRNRGFDRRISFIEYTEHARCRMQCRKISQAEVEEIMRDGKINYNKSGVNDKPCPTYALEGITRDNQRVRIVFGQCDYKTKVITCIDLDTDWECHCPGDDSKYKNKK